MLVRVSDVSDSEFSSDTPNTVHLHLVCCGPARQNKLASIEQIARDERKRQGSSGAVGMSVLLRSLEERLSLEGRDAESDQMVMVRKQYQGGSLAYQDALQLLMQTVGRAALHEQIARLRAEGLASDI